jgi:hypothetical protein
VPSHNEKRQAEEELQDILLTLAQIGPDAMMRMILRIKELKAIFIIIQPFKEHKTSTFLSNMKGT